MELELESESELESEPALGRFCRFHGSGLYAKNWLFLYGFGFVDITVTV